ncbi:hypothetical protein [Mycolicibacterium houstonense]|uniref:hypothetical protein n=1 Tax=Mycolicibacterium houstonense TaxID=146021 RepID=UPI000835D321
MEAATFLVCGWVLCLIRAPEQRRPLASSSDNGPRPWMRIEAERVLGAGTVTAVSTPASVSASISASTASSSSKDPAAVRNSSRVAPDCTARSNSASCACVIPAGGRTSTARRGSHPSWTASSGRSRIGLPATST